MADAETPLRDETVSFDSEELILVDEQDREIGSMSKARCHAGNGTLHRAFSLFVFNRAGQLLLQQRADTKRLWPRYWSNSCCSHPRRGETMEQAVHRRLWQELGIQASLDYLYKFRYQARFGSRGSEHELCWVYLGVSGDEPSPNRQEVADWCWIAPGRLDDALQEGRMPFTPWFKMEWRRLRGEFERELTRYIG